MEKYISFDSHKHYTLAEREDVETFEIKQERIRHERGAIRDYLRDCSRGTAVAVEASGSYYWIVDEIEEAGCNPMLVHPRKAKLMMGMINKTDKLDVHGLNRLQRNQTLPTVWIPPAELRDLRELTRTRIVLVQQRTRLKNRVSATLTKYGLLVKGCSDVFGVKGQEELKKLMKQLPHETQCVSQMLLEQTNYLTVQILVLEKRIEELVKMTPEMQRLMTLPGIGKILSSTIMLEIGTIERFSDAERLASYSGTTPRVISSGDKTRYGHLRKDVNQYLKWAYSEAANTMAANHLRCPDRHVSMLYKRVRHRKGHAVAVGAVARHLAEATYYVLSRKQTYRDPKLRQCSTREA